MSVRRRAITSAAAQGVGMALSAAATLVSAAWLGPSLRGVVSMATTAGQIGAVLLSLGTGTGLTVLVARRTLSIRGAWHLSICISLLSVAVAVVAGSVLSPVLTNGRDVIATWLPWAVAVCLLSNLQTAVAVGSGRIETMFANLICTGAVLSAGYAFCAATFPRSGGVAMAVWVGAQLCGDVIGWALLLHRQAHGTSGLAALPELIRLSVAAVPAAVLGVANTRADLLVLGMLLPASEVGRYAIASLGGLVVLIGPSALGQAAASQYGSNIGGAQVLLRRVVSRGIAISAATFAVALACAYLGVPVLLGREYAGTTAMFAVMGPGLVLFGAFQSSVTYMTVVMKKPRLPGLVAGLCLGVDLLALFGLAPTLGGFGAAIASTLASISGGGLALWMLRAELLSRMSNASAVNVAGDCCSIPTLRAKPTSPEMRTDDVGA